MAAQLQDNVKSIMKYKRNFSDAVRYNNIFRMETFQSFTCGCTSDRKTRDVPPASFLVVAIFVACPLYVTKASVWEKGVGT